MEVSEEEYKKLKRQADQARTDHDRAQGQLEAAMDRLEEDFECSTLAEANKLQKSLDKAATKAEADYQAAKKQFEAEWAERLEDE